MIIWETISPKVVAPMFEVSTGLSLGDVRNDPHRLKH
jgi:hypothetical protein